MDADANVGCGDVREISEGDEIPFATVHAGMSTQPCKGFKCFRTRSWHMLHPANDGRLASLFHTVRHSRHFTVTASAKAVWVAQAASLIGRFLWQLRVNRLF